MACGTLAEVGYSSTVADALAMARGHHDLLLRGNPRHQRLEYVVIDTRPPHSVSRRERYAIHHAYHVVNAWHVTVSIFRRHRYGPRTAYGERVMWRHANYVDVPATFVEKCHYLTKEEAMDGARAWIKAMSDR
jgi:hypothetical protein